LFNKKKYFSLLGVRGIGLIEFKPNNKTKEGLLTIKKINKTITNSIIKRKKKNTY